jgi:putative oxidoreductase
MKQSVAFRVIGSEVLAMKAAFVVGRMMFGGFFVYNGINHFLHCKEMAQYAKAKKMPNPEAAVIASGVALVGGGASMILGVQPKLGAAAIVGFLATASPAFHNFWDHEDPNRRQNELAHFTKNLAMAGAAIALAGVDEPWPVSIPTGKKPTLLQRVGETAQRFLV